MSGKGSRWAVTVTTCVLACVLAGTVAAPASASGVHEVHARTHVVLRGLFSVGRAGVTVPWHGLKVAGWVRPYVPGQVVRVLLLKDGKVLKDKRLHIRSGPKGNVGWFRVRVASPVTGHIRIDVIHAASRRMSHFIVPRKIEVLAPHASFGSGGTFVRLIQERLSRLHFYIPQTGRYDDGMAWALDAYHRLRGWGTSRDLDSRTIKAILDGAGAFHIRFPGHGKHAEGDLGKQLLALINGNKVYWILPISSGKPSTPTILGDYHIYRRDPGYNSEGMYYSDYFIRGYAIHGFDPSPDYPASHGCLRLPIPDAIPVYNWLAMGDWVDTYY